MRRLPDPYEPVKPSDGFDPFEAAGFAGYPACRLATFDSAAARAAGAALTASERARLDRLVSPARRLEMAGSFWIRRRLIEAMTGSAEADIALVASAEGAPRVLHPAGWSISLANKGHDTVVALAPSSQDIGVDIEHVRPIAWRGMLAMVCRGEERMAISQAFDKDNAGERAFFRMWTLKEAILKATGLGFQADAKAIETAPSDLAGPGEGTLRAFGSLFDYWSTDTGASIVSLVRRRS